MSKLRPESVYIKHLKGLIQTLFLGFLFWFSVMLIT